MGKARIVLRAKSEKKEKDSGGSAVLAQMGAGDQRYHTASASEENEEEGTKNTARGPQRPGQGLAGAKAAKHQLLTRHGDLHNI